MRRLAARLLITFAALAVGATVASCSDAAGLAYAQGATRPVAGTTTATATATATVPASAGAKTTPVGPVITVVGAPKGVKAKAGILMDATTGQVIWAKGATATRPIASITKVMTALVILQAGGLNREVKVPKSVTAYVAKYDAESAGLRPGQVFTVEELLKGMLIESAADAAYTLANAYGPGLPAFVAKMNAEAAHLGLVDTHFTSPDGLPYPTETSTYSTPAELVTLGQIAMSYPVFRSIVAMRFYNLPKGDGHGAYSFSTDNPLLLKYPGDIGIKTGFTNGAGHTLLFEAVRNGRTLIGDVLGSPDTGPAAGANDAAKVLNWGFALSQSG